MISDTLFDAAREIERCLTDPTFAPCYENDLRTAIVDCLAQMKRLTSALDGFPSAKEGAAWLAAQEAQAAGLPNPSVVLAELIRDTAALQSLAQVGAQPTSQEKNRMSQPVRIQLVGGITGSKRYIEGDTAALKSFAIYLAGVAKRYAKLELIRSLAKLDYGCGAAYCDDPACRTHSCYAELLDAASDPAITDAELFELC